MNRLPGIILNAVLIDIGWAACVLGAAAGVALLGPGVVALLVALHWGINRPCYGELSLIAFTTAFGLAVDSALSASGFFSFDGATVALAPLWLVALWTNLATAVNWCLGWMRGRLWLQSLFGAIVGPFAYYVGTRLGALEFPQPLGLTIGVLVIVWAVGLPIIYAANDLLLRRLGREGIEARSA